MAPSNRAGAGGNVPGLVVVLAGGDCAVQAFECVLAVVVVAVGFLARLVAPQGNGCPLRAGDLMELAALGAVVAHKGIKARRVGRVFAGQAVRSAVVVAGLILAHPKTVDLHAVHPERGVYAGVCGRKHITQAEFRDKHHNARHFSVVVLHGVVGANAFQGQLGHIKISHRFVLLYQ